MKNIVSQILNKVVGEKLVQCYSDKEIKENYITKQEAKIRIQKHLKNRREKGEIGFFSPQPRVFIAVKQHNWEKTALVESWEGVAEFIHFDWNDKFDQYSKQWHTKDKYDFNEVLYNEIYMENKKKKIDLFFSYLSGRWVFPKTIEKIKKLGVITVNYDFDDTLKFWGYKEKTGYSGSADIANAYDFCITAQSEKNVGKYILVGANPFFMPSAGNEKVFGFKNPEKERDILINFIGQKYGNREMFIRNLKKDKVNICVRGKGWASGSITQDQMCDVYSRSLLSLGFGFIDDSHIGLKGRDFEVLMTGSAYITTYNPELENYFQADKEIIFYRDYRELITKINYYSEHRDEAIKIGLAGREKALNMHKWSCRWNEILEICKQ